MGALAIGSADPAVGTGMGERKPPPIAPTPLEPIGEKWNRKPFALQDSSHKAIETVRDDGHDHALPRAEAHESTEAGVYPDIANFIVELLGRRAQERHLAPHTLARRHPPGLPRVLDVAPNRIGEPLKKSICGIVGRHRAIEVDENTTLHASARRRHEMYSRNDAAPTSRALCSAALQTRWQSIVHAAISMLCGNVPTPGPNGR